MTRTCNCFADENTPGYDGHLPTCNLHYPSGCSGIMPDEEPPAADSRDTEAAKITRDEISAVRQAAHFLAEQRDGMLSTKWPDDANPWRDLAPLLRSLADKLAASVPEGTNG